MRSPFANFEQYFKETIHVFGCSDPLGEKKNEELMQLESGIHKFPFSYRLPQSLPSSFEGKFGYIRYTVTAVLDIINDESIVMERPFGVVLADNDFDSHEALKSPFTAELSTTFNHCLFCNSKALFIAANIPQQCYNIGEEVTISVDIVNRSRAVVRDVTIELAQFIIYKRFLVEIFIYDE